VFHVSLLEPYKQREGAARDPLPGPIELDDEEDQEDRYEVEEIRGSKGRNRILQYLVKWKGWPEEYNEWVLAEDIDEDVKETYDGHFTPRGKRKRK
jgi:Chromo (CHRromatin Organisation MOdifier) domain